MIEKVFIKLLYDINKDYRSKNLEKLKKEFIKLVNDYKNGKISEEQILLLLQIALALYKSPYNEKMELAESLLKINNLDIKYKDFVVELTKLDDRKIRAYIYELIIKNENFNRKL